MTDTISGKSISVLVPAYKFLNNKLLFKKMDSRATPISQINPNLVGEGDGGSLSADILREMEMSQQQPPVQQEQQHHVQFEEPQEEEYEEEEFMVQNAELARQYLIKEVVVIVIAYIVLQMPQVVDGIQRILTKYLTKLSGKMISYVDIGLRALLLAVLFVLVREFLL